MGGVCYFSICGSGETTLQKGLEDIIYNILSQGHYVNITTNGTVTKRLQDIIDKAKPYISHLHFAFSFHYLELERMGLVENFFCNVKMVKDAGASIVVQFNMYDGYVPYLEKIKELCIKNTGAMPQIAATRKEEIGLQKIELMTRFSENEYRKLGDSFHSPLFEFTLDNFNIKRKEFCYAGDWSAILDLSTGIMRRCYSSYIYQDIFKNPEEKIRFLAMGNCCGSPFCMNSSHFMSLGVIPEIATPTYAQLRNRSEGKWYSDEIEAFLSSKLCESNDEYKDNKKVLSKIVGYADENIRKTYRAYKRMIKK